MVLSTLLTALLAAGHVPAALLLGPMVAGIVVASSGTTLRLPASAYLAAQAMLGCLIARSLPLSAFSELARDWPLFLAGIAAVIATSSTLGWLLARWQVLPGSVAIWGSSPGAALAMTLMADAYGADARLVAFMQYLRVACVVVAAALAAKFWGADVTAPAPLWFPPVAWGSLAATLAMAGFGAVGARRLGIPAGALLGPLVLGVLVQPRGWLTIELPPWLLAVGYALVGWSIGLRFTRAILRHAARALPPVLASILVLQALCALLAWVLVTVAGIDPLTAYLATSPGGADSVTIIAANSPVDMPFVVAMQTARLLIVILIGPHLARFIADRTVRQSGE